MPAIPDGERGRRAAAAPAGSRAARAHRGRAASPSPVDRRKLFAASRGGVCCSCLSVLYGRSALLTSGDDNGKSNADATPVHDAGQTGQQATQRQRGGHRDRGRAERQAEQLLVQATGLAPSSQSQGYYVLAVRQPERRQVARRPGHRQERQPTRPSAPCRRTTRTTSYIDISRQQIAGNAAGSTRATRCSAARCRPEEVDRADRQDGRHRPDRPDARRPSRALGQQLAGVHDPGRVERALGGAQHARSRARRPRPPARARGRGRSRGGG